MRLIQSLSAYLKSLKKLISDFPVECILCLIIFSIWNLRELGIMNGLDHFLLVAFPAVCFAYAMHVDFGRRSPVYWGATLVWVPFIFMDLTLDADLRHVWFWMFFIVALALVLQRDRSQEDSIFIMWVTAVLRNLFLGFVIGGFGLLVALFFVHSMGILFEFSVPYIVFSSIYGVFMSFVIPLVCCSLMSHGVEIDGRSSFFWSVFRFVVTPLLVVVSVVCVLFGLYVLLSDRGSDSLIVVMLVVHMSLGLFGTMLSLAQAEPVCKWFYKYFPFISIPSLALAVYMIVREIAQWGVTEWTLYASAITLLLLFSFYLLVFSHSKKRFWVIVHVWTVIMAIAAWLPGYDLESVAIHSQQARLQSLAQSLGFTANASVADVKKMSGSFSAESLDNYDRLCFTVKYLMNAHAVPDEWGRFACQMPDSHSVHSWARAVRSGSVDFQIKAPAYLDLGDYSVLRSDLHLSVVSPDSIIFADKSNREVLRYDLRRAVSVADSVGSGLSDSLSVASNDSLMMVITSAKAHLSPDGGYVTYNSEECFLIFGKE